MSTSNAQANEIEAGTNIPHRNPGSEQPLWVQFAVAVAARIERAGIELVKDKGTASGFPENKGWVRLEVLGGPSAGTKLYVPRAKTRLGHLETTVEFRPNLDRGVLPLPAPRSGKQYSNGAIRSWLAPDHEKASTLFIEAVNGGTKKPMKRFGQQEPTAAIEASATASTSQEESPETQAASVSSSSQ